MAKQKSGVEELFFSLGIGSNADDIFRAYIKEIANGKLREYQEIIQWGAKAGQSLYLHILNGICVLERLRPILDLDDIEVQVLFSAFSVHDLNKLEEFQNEKRSFNYLANAKNINSVLTNLEIEKFFPEWQDYLKDIEVLVRAHSRFHNTYDETLDLNYDPYSLKKNRLLKYLIPIIRAMDVVDLSKTLEERAKKQDFLKEINSLFDDVRYKFAYHKVSEQRGILTNLIHNEVVRYLETEKDLLPLLYYSDGVAYLVDQNRDVHITTDEITAIGNRIVDNIESKTRGEFSKFIQGSPAGIKVDEKCLSLGLSFQQIWSEVWNIISERKYATNVDAMNERCRGRLQAERRKLVGTKPSKKNPDPAAQIVLIDEILAEEAYLLPPDDVAVKIGELVRTYYIFLKKHFSQNIPDAWHYIYDLLKLPLEIENTTLRPRYTAFNALSDRGYIIGRDLYNSGMDFDEVYELILQDGTNLVETLQTESEFGVLEDYVHKYVDFDFAVGRSKDFVTNLTRYVKNNHVQCSTCGSEFDTDLWMKPDVPPNIKVQQFSNRLEGGAPREPKRRVCSVCRTQYTLDKICYNVTSSTSTFFIHLYPPSFFTDVLINAFRSAQNRFRNPDFPAVYLKTYDAFRSYRETAQLVLPVSQTKSNGNPLPKFSEALGNILTIPVNTPGRNNHTENVLYAVENALLYQRFLGCRAVLTDSSIPLFSDDEFSHLFIDHIPPAFRGWLPDNNLNSDMTRRAFEQLLNLHGIRSKIGSFEADDLVRLIRSLNYDALELYYVTHRMIKREHTGNEPRQFATVRDTAPLIAKVVEQKGGTIMSHIKELTRIAWEGNLRGQSRKDNSLAKPLDIAFDCLSRWNENRFKREDIRAFTSKEIARAIERLTPGQYLSDTRREKILRQSTEFVDVLLNQLLDVTYQGKLNELVEDHRKIRSTYIFYIHTEMIAASEKKRRNSSHEYSG